jgi:hypothetical protein
LLRKSFTVIILLTCFSLALAGCTGGSSSSGQPVQTKARSTTFAGSLQAVWRISGRAGAQVDQTAYDPQRHVLYYVSYSNQENFDNVRAVNVVTGATLWQTYVQGKVGGILPEKDRVILAPQGSSLDFSGDENYFWVLNAATGAIELGLLALSSNGKVAGLSGGNIITEGDSDQSDSSGIPIPALTAYSLKTGLRSWQATPHCTGDPVADDAVIATLCESAVVGLRPSDGSEEWRYSTKTDTLASLYLHDGVIEVQSPGQITFIDERGRKILSAPISTQTDNQTPVYFGVVGSHLEFADEDAAGQLEVTVADLATGKIDRSFTLPGWVSLSGINVGNQYYPAGIDFAADAVYLPVDLPPAFLGKALLELNIQDGSQTLNAESAQLASERTLRSDDDVSDAVTAPVGGTTMLVAPSSATADGLVGYRVSPPAHEPASRKAIRLEGVARQWPAACTLLAPADKQLLQDKLGSGYHAVPETQTAAAVLPNASTCQYVPATSSAASVSVSVMWDADSTAAAEAVLSRYVGTNYNSDTSGPPVSGPWDLGYRISGGLAKGDGVAMVVGSLIVEVYDTLQGVGQPFAESLATWLRTHHR